MAKEEKVFRVQMSRGIIGFYWVVLIFLILITMAVPSVAGMDTLPTMIFVLVFSFVIMMFLSMILSAYKMKFIVNDNDLTINDIFFTRTIKKSDIKSVEKTLIPIGFRLFGASFLGGIYYIPGIGRSYIAMGNFNDGVMIKTKDGKNFIITPEKPQEFIKALK
jgi:hypothetical protein